MVHFCLKIRAMLHCCLPCDAITFPGLCAGNCALPCARLDRPARTPLLLKKTTARGISSELFPLVLFFLSLGCNQLSLLASSTF